MKREILCERSREELKQLLKRKIKKEDVEDKDIRRGTKNKKGWRGGNKKSQYKAED